MNPKIGSGGLQHTKAIQLYPRLTACSHGSRRLTGWIRIADLVRVITSVTGPALPCPALPCSPVPGPAPRHTILCLLFTMDFLSRSDISLGPLLVWFRGRGPW